MAHSNDRAEPDVVHALSDPALPDQAERFYSRLIERMKDLNDGSRRHVYVLLLVAGIMELLDRAVISEAQLGPFKISDLSVIRKVLPVVAGYLIYELCANGIRYLQSRRIANTVVQHFQPKMHAMGHYPRLTYPIASPLFGPFPWHESKTWAFRSITLFTLILRTGSLAAPVLLETWWFVRLFQTYGAADPLVWASAIATSGFMVFAGLLILEGLASNMISGQVLVGIRTTSDPPTEPDRTRR